MAVHPTRDLARWQPMSGGYLAMRLLSLATSSWRELAKQRSWATSSGHPAMMMTRRSWDTSRGMLSTTTTLR
eukprot:5351097-Prymnesium_polylepis.2